MTYDTLLYETVGAIGIIRLNRPKVLNAMNARFWEEFEHLLNQIKTDESIHVIIITGSGRAFSTGADLKESKGRSTKAYRAYLVRLQKVSESIIFYEKPIIAAINGYAVGSGYELALACDIRIAASDAKIGSPEAKVSSSATGGSFKLLYDLIGPGRAKELLFTGDYIDGQKALEIGLVNATVPGEKLMETALGMAQKIAENATISLSMIKKGFGMVQNQADFSTLMDFEIKACLACVSDTSRKVALSNFEKRKQKPNKK